MGGKISRMERVMEENDKRERKKNIVIKGLQTQEKNTKDKIEKFLEEDIKVKSKVEWIKVVGRENKRVIIARLKNESDKEEIM